MKKVKANYRTIRNPLEAKISSYMKMIEKVKERMEQGKPSDFEINNPELVEALKRSTPIPCRSGYLETDPIQYPPKTWLTTIEDKNWRLQND